MRNSYHRQLFWIAAAAAAAGAAPGLPTAWAEEAVEARGDLIIRRYGHDGEVTKTVEAPFDLTSSADRYQIRMLTYWDNYEQGMFVASDRKITYKSNIVREVDRKDQTSFRKHAYATIDAAALPTFPSYGWGPVQALALAERLTRNREAAREGAGIRAELVPEVVATNARGLGLPLIRTQLMPGDRATGFKVLFWAVAKDDTQSELNPREGSCLLIAELRVESVSAGLPTDMYFVINLLHATKSGQPKLGSPFVDASFHAITTVVDGAKAFGEKAYDRGVDVQVTDHRFPDVPRLGYVLTAQDGIPFDISPSAAPTPATRAHEEVLARRAAKSMKQTMVVTTLVLTTGIGLGLVYFASNRRKKNKTTNNVK
ncbi:MAG: hypothetical protein NTV51_11120 [Verrucomicrobia bacterium]|nr:hypothetical protein [Verrucomicrobiota bacterium]